MYTSQQFIDPTRISLMNFTKIVQENTHKCRLVFAKRFFDHYNDYSNSIWADETKIEFFRHNQQRYVCRKKEQSLRSKIITIPTVKYGRGH